MKAFLIGFIAAVVGLFVGASMNWLLAVNINTSGLPEVDPMDPAHSRCAGRVDRHFPGKLHSGVCGSCASSRTGSLRGRGHGQVTPRRWWSSRSVCWGVVNFINLWEVTPLWMLLEFPVYFLLGGVGLRAGFGFGGWASWPTSRRIRQRGSVPQFVLPLGQAQRLPAVTIRPDRRSGSSTWGAPPVLIRRGLIKQSGLVVDAVPSTGPPSVPRVPSPG